MIFAHAGRFGTDDFVSPTGTPVPTGTVVTVYVGSTDVAAGLFTDRDRSAAAPNPFTLTARGNVWFFTEPGFYEVEINGGRVTVAVPVDTDDVANLIGPPGPAATADAGTTTTGAPGSNAAVVNSGTTSDAIFDFTIPRGDPGINGQDGSNGVDGSDGADATVAAGSTTTGAPGSSASVTDSGVPGAAIFDFTIPRGDVGAAGNDGSNGVDGNDGAAATATAGTTTTGVAGSSASVANSGSLSAAIFDFTIPRGDTGAAGTNGTNGAPGTPGNTVLYGTSIPTGGNGVDGNFYIRTTTHFLYGPKAGGIWPAGSSLVGPTGAAGNTVLYGSAAPTSEGVNGNFYIRTTTSFLYGPKSGGVWPAGTSLIGPAGANGTNGTNGTNGSDGAPGAAATATAGSATTGAPGSSASVVNSGTTAAAIFDFTIPRGDTGAAGSNGSNGAAGQGVPTAGSAAQVLRKIDGTDYNTQWHTLGAASELAVGTTAGTVAAGDDSRIVGAVQTSRTVSGHALSADVTFEMLAADLWPDKIFLDVFAAATNTAWSTFAGGTFLYGGLKSTDNNNQNNAIEWPVNLRTGTWEITVYFRANSSSGIASVQLDGVQKGTVDFYNSTQTNSNVGVVAGVAVTPAARMTLKLLMSAKNGSSSNYAGNIHGVSLRRTGA